MTNQRTNASYSSRKTRLVNTIIKSLTTDRRTTTNRKSINNYLKTLPRDSWFANDIGQYVSNQLGLNTTIKNGPTKRSTVDSYLMQDELANLPCDFLNTFRRD